jgi:hypothetical protein
MIDFNYNDGGRKEAGFTGTTGDCVTRAIAIATQIPYQEVYTSLFQIGKEYASTHHSRVAKRIAGKGASPRDGVFKEVSAIYLKRLGWKWTPTMFIGQGCKVHVRRDELPSGRLVLSLSRHFASVIDGVLNDTYNCSRGGTRCVYGYWSK